MIVVVEGCRERRYTLFNPHSSSKLFNRGEAPGGRCPDGVHSVSSVCSDSVPSSED